MLKYTADLRAVAYMIITTAMFYYQWNYGTEWWMYIIYLHFSIAVSVMTHNHKHIGIWKSKFLNVLTDWWLTVFYGVPVFTWIPTHNRNHHKFNNKEGDSSLTYRVSEKNNIFTLLTYPFMSGFYQMKVSVKPYMKQVKENDKPAYYEALAQIAILVIWIAAFLILDWQKALIYVIIPQQVSGYSVFIFNYVQHVHADEESEYNHSRNFMGVNLFLFNNGYHTAHHEFANIHWSEIKAAHDKIKDKIDPKLIEGSLWYYLFRVYVFGAIFKGLTTTSMRLQRLATGSKKSSGNSVKPMSEEITTV